MMNSSMDALREAQKAFAGEAEKASLKNDELWCLYLIYSNNHIKLNTRNERSRYVENVPCVCFFLCQHTIKQASAKLSYIVIYPTPQVYTSRVLISLTVRNYKKRFESSVGL